MNLSINRLRAGLAVAAITLSGCAFSFGQPPVDTAGVFWTTDQGETWQETNRYLFSGGVDSIAGVSVRDIVFDPSDSNAVYLLSDRNGIFYSYDGGVSWQSADSFGVGLIRSLAVDPSSKCTIYATLANTVRKSVDCSRTWQEVYIDTRPNNLITAVAVDSFNPLVVYAGTLSGDVLKSFDGGSTWQVIQRLGEPVEDILIYGPDTRTVYVPTAKRGIFKTTDGGQNWIDLNDGLKPYSASLEYKDLFFDTTTANALIHVSKYGLLRSDDGGETWTNFQLITPPASVDITAATIHPDNNQIIYYSTASTFYMTVDGGQNWVTRRLPTTNPPSTLILNPTDTNTIYMGMRIVQQ